MMSPKEPNVTVAISLFFSREQRGKVSQGGGCSSRMKIYGESRQMIKKLPKELDIGVNLQEGFKASVSTQSSLPAVAMA